MLMGTQIRISECYDVQSGAVLSRYLVKDSRVVTPYKYKRLSLSAIDALGTVDDSQNEICYAQTEIGSQSITQDGDIVMKSMPPYTAFKVDKKELEGLLLSSNFFVFRLKSPALCRIFDPDYLYWVLCSPARLESCCMPGDRFKRLRAGKLEKLALEAPEIEKQRLIGRLYVLRIRQLVERQRYSQMLKGFYLEELAAMDELAAGGEKGGNGHE